MGLARFPTKRQPYQIGPEAGDGYDLISDFHVGEDRLLFEGATMADLHFAQMDIGGGVFASKIAKSRTVTVAIEAMNFRKPVYVGDLVSVHANLVKIGHTSITVHLEAWVLRRKEMQSILVTDGNFTYVSIDDDGHPQVVQHAPPPVSA